MTDFLVVPDREGLAGFRLPSVLRRALDAYARCYNGGRAPDWPEHEVACRAVLEVLGEALDRQQAEHDLAAIEAIPFLAIGNSEPIPAGLPPALREAIVASRRRAGWDAEGKRLWPLGERR